MPRPRWTPTKIKNLQNLTNNLRIAKALVSKAWGLLEGVTFTAEDFDRDGFAPLLSAHDIEDDMQAIDHVERHLAETARKIQARLRRVAPPR